jgi:hypothetical protein
MKSLTRNRKLTGIFLSAALLTGGCSTVVKTVTPTVTDQCDIIMHSVVQKNGVVVSDETYTDPRQPYASRCGGERELAMKELYDSKVMAARKEQLIRIIAVRAAVEMDNPEMEAAFTRDLLALVNAEAQEISHTAIKAVEEHKDLSLERINSKVLEEDVLHLLSVMYDEDGRIDPVSYAMLEDIYNQGDNDVSERKYRALDETAAREAIDNILADEGYDMSYLAADVQILRDSQRHEAMVEQAVSLIASIPYMERSDREETLDQIAEVLGGDNREEIVAMKEALASTNTDINKLSATKTSCIERPDIGAGVMVCKFN